MVIEPATAEEVASALRQAAERAQTLVIRGAGTKSAWGRATPPADVTLCTRRLNRVLAHEHGDLTATVEAGAPLAEVNRALARAGQWLPLDPPFADRATIGGVLATNDSGPLRHRYGAPRDLVIGVQLATIDGVLARAGGRVVKNVAGYDLSKLVAGSFGSLAAIICATFKLAPLPAASKTLVVSAPEADGAVQASETVGRIVGEVTASQLEPVAFEIAVAGRSPQRSQAPHTQVFLRFASVPAAVDAQLEQARRLSALKDWRMRVVDGDAEAELWNRHARDIWEQPGAVVRASWLPANIATAICELSRIRPSDDVQFRFVGRAAIGAGLIQIDGDTHAQASTIEALRRSSSFGNVVVIRGSTELKSMVDVWGPQGGQERIFTALKHALDPNGVLNAGRGPL